MRLVPFSYFCTWLNVSPRCRPRVPWLIPRISRRCRVRCPTCTSTSFAVMSFISSSDRWSAPASGIPSRVAAAAEALHLYRSISGSVPPDGAVTARHPLLRRHPVRRGIAGMCSTAYSRPSLLLRYGSPIRLAAKPSCRSARTSGRTRERDRAPRRRCGWRCRPGPRRSASRQCGPVAWLSDPVGDDQARALPDLLATAMSDGITPGGICIDAATQGVAQHVGVAAPFRGRRHDSRAADHPSVAHHQRVVRAGIVVLVHLDVVVVRDVPSELVDEERLSAAAGTRETPIRAGAGPGNRR